MNDLSTVQVLVTIKTERPMSLADRAELSGFVGEALFKHVKNRSDLGEQLQTHEFTRVASMNTQEVGGLDGKHIIINSTLYR